LFAMIILPLFLIPVLLVVMGEIGKSQYDKIESSAVNLAIQGEAYAPELVNLFEQNQEWFEVHKTSDAQQALEEREVQGALIIPADLSARLEARQPVEITLLTDSTKTATSFVQLRTTQTIALFNQAIINQRLAIASQSFDILSGINLINQDSASQDQIGGFMLGMILPMFIVMWTITGGQYTAIDASAGERERKTLEALLLTPVSHWQVVLGKFLAVSLAAIISVVLSLISLLVTFQLPFTSIAEQMGEINIQPLAMIVMLGIGIILSFMFSALQLSVGIFAKSFKEAQSYVTPLYLVAILPITFIQAIPDFSASRPFYLIPGVNAVLLFKENLLGKYDIINIAITTVSLLIYTMISIAVAKVIYSKENVLFRD